MGYPASPARPLCPGNVACTKGRQFFECPTILASGEEDGGQLGPVSARCSMARARVLERVGFGAAGWGNDGFDFAVAASASPCVAPDAELLQELGGCATGPRLATSCRRRSTAMARATTRHGLSSADDAGPARKWARSTCRCGQ